MKKISVKVKAFDKNAIKGVLERLAPLYARKHGVTVRWGDGFYTDGKTITLQAMREDISENLLLMLEWGFLHELGHVLFTPMEDRIPWIKSHESQVQKTAAFVENVIEDTRIERLINNKFKGTPPICQQAVSGMINGRDYDKIDDPLKILGDLIYLRTRSCHIEDKGYDRFDPDIPEKVADLYHKVFDDLEEDIKNLGEYSEVLAISDIILERLKDLSAPPPPEEPGEDSNPLAVGDIIRVKKNTTYGQVTYIAETVVFFRKITKEVAKTILKEKRDESPAE